MTSDSDTMLEPACFTDRKGRRWTIELDYGLAKRVLKTCGVDLVNGGDGQAWLRLRDDVSLLVQVLWLVCQEQAEEIGVDEEAFGRGLAGDALGEAVVALERAWVVFCQPAKRRVMAAILERVHAVTEAQTNLAVETIQGEKATALLQRKLAEAAQAIDREFDRQTCGGLGSSLPASSASRRGTSP